MILYQYVKRKIFNESMAYLNDVSVLPEFQNRGLASLFTKQFADDMRTAGVKEIILDTRKDTGEQKKNFAKTNQKMYARLGFVDRIETFQTLIKESIGTKELKNSNKKAAMAESEKEENGEGHYRRIRSLA
jgi:ribosomal protein S18 acetylase RimI-like enzyme